MWALMEDRIRRMTPRERIERSVALTILAHSFALAQIRQKYPNESDRQHRLRLAARFIDPAVMRAAFGFPDD